MKALFLAPEPPYPAHGGGAIRAACMLEWLARRADVYALTCQDAASTGESIRTDDLCRRVERIRLPQHSYSMGARVGRNLNRAARGIPPMVDRFSCPEVGDGIRKLLVDGPFDVAVFEHFWMAPWIDLVREHAQITILDLHNRESDFCRAFGGPLSGWFASCAERLESKLLPQFDHVWDPQLAPTGLPWRDEAPASDREFDIAFSAGWDYPPNQDGLRWFFKKVWPEIVATRPATKIVLIGHHDHLIPAWIRRDRNVTITGRVDDSAAWLERASVAIAPLRRGAGVSVKIAEAWRAGCAMVATSIGARGYIRGESGDKSDGLVVADRPEAFAAAILHLLLDFVEHARLAREGRQRFEREYSWDAVHDRLDRLIPVEVMR